MTQNILELSATQQVLKVLIGQSLTRGEIAHRTGFHPATVSRALKKLLAAGMISRAGRKWWRAVPNISVEQVKMRETQSCNG